MAQEAGFELRFPDATEAEFFPFAIGMSGAKDLKIIDRCTQMPLDEFAEAFDDPSQRGRGIMMLAMIGLSIRAKHPDWSVERIMHLVDELELNEVTFLGTEEEESNGSVPLTEEPKPEEDSSSSGSPSDASESSAIPAETIAPEPTHSTSEPSSEIQA
jgi:hypothetical protein